MTDIGDFRSFEICAALETWLAYVKAGVVRISDGFFGKKERLKNVDGDEVDDSQPKI